MSRFVAGFAIFYVCAVSGQQNPPIRLKGTPNDPSIAIGEISGGNYPEGSFSIGHGDNNDNGDGGHGADFGVNGGNGQFNPDYSGGNGQNPNTGTGRNSNTGIGQNPNTGTGHKPNIGTGQGENERGYINGQIDIGGFGGQSGQNSGINEYGVPSQNPGKNQTNPYDDNFNKQTTTNAPVRNSASRNSFFSVFFQFILRWISRLF